MKVTRVDNTNYKLICISIPHYQGCIYYYDGSIAHSLPIIMSRVCTSKSNLSQPAGGTTEENMSSH